MRMSKYIFIGLSFVFALVLQGAIPFVGISTLGQSIAVVGYPISFFNEGGLSIYATNMGYPSSAAMSTMLAPALVMNLFLWLGIEPQDSFNFAFVLWFSLGYYGAFKLAQKFYVDYDTSALLALLWMAFPIVWNSSDYSHLHFGLVLLPFLFFVCVECVCFVKEESVYNIFLYLIATLLAVFTDGYTFILFAVGSSIILLHQILIASDARIELVKKILPMHFLSFLVAYIFYALYIGKSEYTPVPLNFFRGWGLDLLFLFQPTQGVHWLWDLIGFSSQRSDRAFFGDASVWISTFSLPIIFAGLIAYIFSRKHFVLAGPMLLIAIFGFYMALGPSLKIDVARPIGMGGDMPSNFEIASTGSAWISENVPGFRSMRASYRWLALCVFGLWGMLLGYFASRKNPNDFVGKIILISIILMFIPNVGINFQKKVRNYDGFVGINTSLVADLKRDLNKNEIVAFLPWGNDFLVNYVAPKVGVRAYNIGGDKNVDAAKRYWPKSLRQLSAQSSQNDYAMRVVKFMTTSEVDAVVFPYVDLLGAAHNWPSSPKNIENTMRWIGELDGFGYFDVLNREYYSLVRLKRQFQSLGQRSIVLNEFSLKYCLSPVCIRSSNFTSSVPRRVGVVADGELIADGNPGFLHFGPYLPLNSGNYNLLVHGKADFSKEAWVDVVSKKGEVNHGKFQIASAMGSENGVLVNVLIKLSESVQDIEVRLYVGPDDKITLSDYTLQPQFGEKNP